MTRMRHLTFAEWHAGPATAFWSLFQSVDPFDEPLRPGVEARALLYPESYMLEEAEFAAVARAGREVGDTHVIVSITEEFGVTAGADANHWQLRGTDYAAYQRLASVGVLENALYSPSGRWGLLMSHEQHAIAGGTARFIHELLATHPEWQKSPTRFVDDWLYRHHHDHVDASWVPQVLRHVYGSGAAWYARIGKEPGSA
jgi:hypothetical protein